MFENEESGDVNFLTGSMGYITDEEGTLSDLNGDSLTNVIDIIMLIQIILGEDEIKRKVGIIKTMSSGDQFEVPLDTIHKHFDIDDSKNDK